MAVPEITGQIRPQYASKSGVLAVLWGILLLASPLCLTSTEKKMRPLSREAVSREWVGLSEDELYVFRILLVSNGTGDVGYLFGQDNPHIFGIRTWKYDGSEIEIMPTPEGARSTGIQRLVGKVVGLSMALTVEGRDWGRRLQLRRESDLEARWSRLRNAMTRNSLIRR